MSAIILKFPPRSRFDIRVVQLDGEWFVLNRHHGWLHGDFHSAIRDAWEIAALDGVGVRSSDWRASL